VTGWTAAYITDELPLEQAFEIEHVALCINGKTCRFIERPSDDTAASFSEQLEDLEQCSPFPSILGL